MGAVQIYEKPGEHEPDSATIMILSDFPPRKSIETDTVLRALARAHRCLAELKGKAHTIPNQKLLISTLSLQEAQDSSAIENIVTSQDELFKSSLQPKWASIASKEVRNYARALNEGFSKFRRNGLLTLHVIQTVHTIVEGNDSGFRKLPGTVLKNERTGEIVYTPPSPEQVPSLMASLERFIHADSALDPLVRMALIHYQFESIHPFYDGNGRTGRILNILYLVKEDLLDSPVLYLSRYINQTKPDYYKKLHEARLEAWEPWLLYMIRGIELTSVHATALVEQIGTLLLQHKRRIRDRHKFYSQDLLNNIFRHPYTKAAFLEKDLRVSRPTATRYLNALASDGILSMHKLGRENYYVNQDLVALLMNPPPVVEEA